MGRDGLLRIAARYELDASSTDEAIIDTLVEVTGDDLGYLVSGTESWGLEIWNDLLESLGRQPVTAVEAVIPELVEALSGRATLVATVAEEEATTTEHGCIDEDDGEPTGYPAYEDLSTDAVLPWTRTKLANFQRRAARAAFDALYHEGRRAVSLCMPEAAGKTRTAADIVLGACVAKGLRALWVGQSRELLDEIHEEIRELAWLVGELGSRRAVFSVSRYGSQHRDVSGDIVLTSPTTLANDGVGLEVFEQHGPIDMICVDDAMMASDPALKSVLQSLMAPHVRLLGLTAVHGDPSTPVISSIRDLFGGPPVFQITFKDLVEARHLARPVFIRKRLGSTANLELEPSELHWAMRSRKDFSGPLLRRMIHTKGRDQEILGHWLDHHRRYGKSIVFAYDRHHAEELVAWLLAHGVPADSVYPGLDHAKRRQRLERFRKKQSQVLVQAGLQTEGEHDPTVQTVVLARPTLSGVLYKHMIGHAARRPPPVIGKSVFYVVDCIDDLEPFGLSLAGRSAAIDLGSDFEDTTTVQALEDLPRVQPHHIKAIISTRAWQILRRFADDQYSVWGVMVWVLPKGEDKSVIVFHEGIARLRAAVDLVEAAVPRDEVATLRELGAELDWLGAVRDIDWQEMLGDCAETKHPPRLEKLDGLRATDTNEACARILAQFVEEMLSGRLPVPKAMAQCDGLLADSEPLQSAFTSIVDLRQEILKLYHDAIARVEVAPASQAAGRELLLDAFLRLTVGVAMADNVLHDAEARAIVKATARMFDLTSDAQMASVGEAVERYRTATIDSHAAAESLRELASKAELYHMYDWLFRVAFADGLFVEQEEVFLRDAAHSLGIPDDEYEELSDKYRATLPKTSVPPPSIAPPSLPLAPRLRYCTQCGYPRQIAAAFCVSCGLDLQSTSPNDSAAAIPD